MRNPEYHIHKSITITASATEVWKALSNPERIEQWLSDDDMVVTSDWKIASQIVFSGKLHGKTKFMNTGTILQFIPDRIFQYSSLSNISNLPDLQENHSVITFEHWDFYWRVTMGMIKRIVESSQS